jgi:hypothetical protein
MIAGRTRLTSLLVAWARGWCCINLKLTGSNLTHMELPVEPN